MDLPASQLSATTTQVYVAVKGSIHGGDSAVFGLNEKETRALVQHFGNYQKEVINGVLLKAAPMQVINALAELGYKVVTSSGEAEIVWTMQRDL